MLALLTVPLSRPAAAATVAAAPVCIERGPGARICSQLDESALSQPGSSTTWRVWVEGPNPPLQVRLHNGLPRRFRVRGGDDQVIHLGCRIHREVRRKVVALDFAPAPALVEAQAHATPVTALAVAGVPAIATAVVPPLVAGAAPPLTAAALGAGSAQPATQAPSLVPSFDVRPYSAVPSRESAAIAAALAPALARVEADFVRRRGELPPGPPAAAAGELLDLTEAELLAALGYQELAALRDYVAAQFRRARTAPPSVGGQSAASGLASPRLPDFTAYLFAADEAPGVRGEDGSMLDRAARVIRRLWQLAENNDLTTSLCLTSEPTRATFRMRAQSLHQWQSDKLTTGEYRDVYRGLYVYSLRKNLKSIECLDPDATGCSPIDLVDDEEPTFQCDFQAGACERRSDPQLPEGCHAAR